MDLDLDPEFTNKMCGLWNGILNSQGCEQIQTRTQEKVAQASKHTW